MKIQIKLLKGELFDIEAEGSDSVQTLKEKIEVVRSELKADRQKLIHSGKVLKDDSSVESLGISESDFLVCMVTKETAKPKPVETPAPAPVPAPAQFIVSPPASAPAPAPRVETSFANPEAIAALVGMGFPESESRAALNAASGNPDLAYEFLLTGIPANAAPQQQFAAVPPRQEGNLDQLRSHPQFNMLKQLIQSNPASLPQVLNLIGQQNPSLLQTINQNESQFLAMMNEPITTAQTAPQTPQSQGFPQVPSSGQNPNPAQIIQALATLPREQQAQFAQSIGLSPEQLAMFMQMVSQMPPGQLEQMIGEGGMGGGMGGMGGNQQQVPPGAIALTHEEMESINRLMALGFSQQQAAQAYIACDRNETLAANLLFENGGFEDDFDDGGDDDDMNH